MARGPTSAGAKTTGDGRTLPWRFLGRQVRPYALAELDAAIRDAEAAARDNPDNV